DALMTTTRDSPRVARLDADEIAHYRQEGWVVPRFRLPAHEVERLREALDALIAANPAVRPEKLVSAHVEGDNGEGVRGDARFLRSRTLHEHLHEDRPDLTLNQRLAAGSFALRDAVDIELEPGQMSLHDVYMIHGAEPNRSDKRRTGVALRYMPSTSVFERDL